MHLQITHHEMGKNVVTAFKKKITEVEHSLSQQRQLVYTATDEFLEHSPSRGSLYYKVPTLEKIILVFFFVPLIHYCQCFFIVLIPGDIFDAL